jgi:hypothetical protein
VGGIPPPLTFLTNKHFLTMQITIKSFDAYTLPQNPYTHLSINTLFSDLEFEIVVRLGGGSAKGESIIEFIRIGISIWRGWMWHIVPI